MCDILFLNLCGNCCAVTRGVLFKDPPQVSFHFVQNFFWFLLHLFGQKLHPKKDRQDTCMHIKCACTA